MLGFVLFFDRARTQFRFSFLPFDNGDPITVLVLRELLALEQPTRSGQQLGGAQSVLLPAVAALPHLCATSPKQVHSRAPEKLGILETLLQGEDP